MQKDFGQIHDVNNPPEKAVTTFCKHKVVENNYGCLQNVVKQQLDSNSSGRGADSDDNENRKGIHEEEEEEENPLPATRASRMGWVMTRRRAGQRRNGCTRTSGRSTTSITHRRRRWASTGSPNERGRTDSNMKIFRGGEKENRSM
jgi:hypothetical protein